MNTNNGILGCKYGCVTKEKEEKEKKIALEGVKENNDVSLEGKRTNAMVDIKNNEKKKKGQFGSQCYAARNATENHHTYEPSHSIGPDPKPTSAS